MLTYKEIKNKLGQSYDYNIPHNCWIAEVKRKNGLTRGPAWNSGKGVGAPPCLARIHKAIECILEENGVI